MWTASPAESPTPAWLKKVITTTACRENDGVDARIGETYLIHTPAFPPGEPVNIPTQTHGTAELSEKVKGAEENLCVCFYPEKSLIFFGLFCTSSAYSNSTAQRLSYSIKFRYTWEISWKYH